MLRCGSRPYSSHSVERRGDSLSGNYNTLRQNAGNCSERHSAGVCLDTTLLRLALFLGLTASTVAGWCLLNAAQLFYPRGQLGDFRT
ncbi:MAG: hypothetical protein KatS3mg055_2074 [Chloroflexus sp.]|nr:MAG: hypothetical protein KatS3mg055_2074 [Chloroflexus sp.]